MGEKTAALLGDGAKLKLIKEWKDHYRLEVPAEINSRKALTSTLKMGTWFSRKSSCASGAIAAIAAAGTAHIGTVHLTRDNRPYPINFLASVPVNAPKPASKAPISAVTPIKMGPLKENKLPKLPDKRPSFALSR